MKLWTALPPIVTADACVKPEPSIVTVVPARPVAGAKLAIAGVPIEKPRRPSGVPMPVGPS